MIDLKFSKDWVKAHIASRPDRNPELKSKNSTKDSGSSSENTARGIHTVGPTPNMHGSTDESSQDIEFGDEEPRCGVQKLY